MGKVLFLGSHNTRYESSESLQGDQSLPCLRVQRFLWLPVRLNRSVHGFSVCRIVKATGMEADLKPQTLFLGAVFTPIGFVTNLQVVSVSLNS